MNGASFFAQFTIDKMLSTKNNSVRGFNIHFYSIIVIAKQGDNFSVLKCSSFHFFAVGTPICIKKDQDFFGLYRKGIFQLFKTQPLHLLFLSEKGRSDHKNQTNAKKE